MWLLLEMFTQSLQLNSGNLYDWKCAIDAWVHWPFCSEAHKRFKQCHRQIEDDGVYVCPLKKIDRKFVLLYAKKDWLSSFFSFSFSLEIQSNNSLHGKIWNVSPSFYPSYSNIENQMTFFSFSPLLVGQFSATLSVHFILTTPLISNDLQS